ncbi:FAD-binding oxidoreductase [Williamsia sterculiae]|uniref:FAD/FMN-containing dehydrogenase n=1 Tax=Williamsia sterculiae TaxID=1344003 RepID=A0A1N7FW12_9NOCA|nr:FAD-binding oxidoreductase [Williamsia sterculiae]SIS04436.1 FAD/FMN-containing dehydrogenase [Williamsia sterculiae]
MTIAPNAQPLAADLTVLSGIITGTVALPGEPGYDRCTPWNVAVPVTPAAVISAANATDVAETVRFARAAGLRVAVQTTGHGASPVADDTILVLTADLDQCVVDPATATARVGAGVTWQRVMDEATPHGLAPLAGSSPDVGVVGFLTGAGIGPLVRTHGLSSDHVLSFDLVTGNGEMVHVTPDTQPELFWGLRGGKSTLGIVTAVEFSMPAISEFYAGTLFFDGADADVVVQGWRRWTAEMPHHASTSLALLQLPPLPHVPAPLAGRFTVAVRFASVADAETAAAVLAPMRAVAPALIDTAGMMPYAAMAAIHADPVDPMPTREHTALLRELTPETVQTLLEVAGPRAESPQVIVELRLLGGALNRPTAHPSAFCHRDAEYSLLAIGVLAPPIADAVGVHGTAVLQAMAPWSTGGALPNFGSAADPDRVARSYDDDTRTRLAELADRHDPDGVLRCGLAVRSGGVV